VKVEKLAKNGQMVQNCYPLSPLLHKSNQHDYEFHFFTDESEGVKAEFIDKMLDVGKGKPMENVALEFHSIDISKIPNLFKLCSTNRLLIPQELSSNINEYIYVDTDVLWLQDPADLFQHFSDFTADQEIGMAYEIESSEKIGRYHTIPQGERKFYGPTGLNAGIGMYKVRDKTKMWEDVEKVIQKHKDNLPLGDQDVLNDYLAHHPLKFYKLACHWNRRTDSGCVPGTQGILHGNRGVFYGALEPINEYALRWNLVKALPFEGFPTVNSLEPAESRANLREETAGLLMY